MLYRLCLILIVLSVCVAGCSSGGSGKGLDDTQQIVRQPSDALPFTQANAFTAVELGLGPLEFITAQLYLNIELLDNEVFPVGVSVSACADGGSKTFEFQDVDVSGNISSGDVMVISDAACRFNNNNNERDGTIRVSYSAGTSVAAHRYIGEVVFEQLILSSSNNNFVLNGILNFDITFGAGLVSQMSITAASGDRPTVEVFRTGSPVLLERTALDTHSVLRTVDAAGAAIVSLDVSVQSETLVGSYRFYTASNLTMNDGEYLNGGTLIFTGANNSAIRVVGSSPPIALVDMVLDEDGNGSFEKTVGGSSTWEDLVAGFLIFLP